MRESFEQLQVVALLAGKPDHGLRSGQVGTVVELLDEGVYEVEFSDETGKPYALAALAESELLALHHAPVLA